MKGVPKSYTIYNRVQEITKSIQKPTISYIRYGDNEDHGEVGRVF
jgi:hypothetical protein